MPVEVLLTSHSASREACCCAETMQGRGEQKKRERVSLAFPPQVLKTHPEKYAFPCVLSRFYCFPQQPTSSISNLASIRYISPLSSLLPPPLLPPPPLRLLSLSLPALSSDVSLQQRSFPSPVSNKTGDWCQSSFTFSPSFRLLLVLSTLYSFIYVLMYSWAVLRRRYPARTTPGGVGLGVVSTSCLPK